MPIYINPAERTGVTRVVCPDCHEKVKGIGLLPGSTIRGLTFRCHRCGKFWSVDVKEKENRM